MSCKYAETDHESDGAVVEEGLPGGARQHARAGAQEEGRQCGDQRVVGCVVALAGPHAQRALDPSQSEVWRERYVHLHS